MGLRAPTGGDSYTQRMRAAATRAIGHSSVLIRAASRLSDELDDVTPVHGVPVTGYDDEDSLVKAISDIIEPPKAAAGG